jgi:hypothetical protein
MQDKDMNMVNRKCNVRLVREEGRETESKKSEGGKRKRKEGNK